MVALVVVLVVGGVLLGGLRPAQAQGFGVYEHGACTQARGAAGVAEPCGDGSAVYVNPAGILRDEGLTLAGGGMLVVGTGRFLGDSGGRTPLDTGAQPVPHAYLVYRKSPKLAFGLGYYVPYGLAVKWPLEFDGRFVSYDSSLATQYIQPTAAYALTDRVSIGGGLTMAISSVTLHRREDLANVPFGNTGAFFDALVDRGTDFADTRLKSSRATGVGVNLGVTIAVHERFGLGARYMSRIALEYDGEATFTPMPGPFRVTKSNPFGLPVGTPLDPFVQQVLAALPDQQASTALDMPAQVVVGASVHAAPRLRLFVDYHWVGWSAFDTVTLDFANSATPDERLIQRYDDTGAVRVGAEFELRPRLLVRGGYAYTQAAAPPETVTPLLPEARRNHFTAGVGWRVRRNTTLDLAYQFVAHEDRRGRTMNPPPGQAPTTTLNSGVYQSRGDLLGVTLTVRR